MSSTTPRHGLFHAIVVVGAGLVAGAGCESAKPHPDATITLLDAKQDGPIVDAPPGDAVDAMVVIL